MVDIASILNTLTTVFTYIYGAIQQIAPIVNKILDKRTTLPPQPTINRNCQPPLCGIEPYFCPESQLSSVCLQRKMEVENSASRRLTTLSQSDNDKNESKDKSLTSISPGSTVMVIFIGVIALAIIGFLFIRCKRQNDYKRSFDDRKSSTWSL